MTFFDYPIYKIPSRENLTERIISSGLVVLVREDDFSEDQKTLVEKILNSVKKELNKAQIELVTDDHLVQFKKLDSIKPLIICFGISPEQCGLQVDKTWYHLLSIGDLTYLFCHPLKVLPDKIEGRRALWNALKRYYRV